MIELEIIIIDHLILLGIIPNGTTIMEADSQEVIEIETENETEKGKEILQEEEILEHEIDPTLKGITYQMKS
jgi:hypothetical protein